MPGLNRARTARRPGVILIGLRGIAASKIELSNKISLVCYTFGRLATSRPHLIAGTICGGGNMGKNTLHMLGLDTRGTIVLREKVSRGRITSRLAKPYLIGIEAGMATHCRAWPRCEAGPARVFEAVSAGAKK
jgi:hypothetical protein